jgi:hypothetical protein
MVCIAEQMIVNHGEFTVSIVVNDGVLCCMIHNHWLRIAPNDSQPMV